jgi:hypothetical protein
MTFFFLNKSIKYVINPGGYMKKLSLLFLVLWSFSVLPLLAQEFTRTVLEVPKADSGAITLDGVLDEAAWESAAKIDLVTSSGFNIFLNYYGDYRDNPTEPDYDEYYARLLWTNDTLYIGIHIDEVVNDSSGLFWDGQWTGDQLFVSLSNRFGVDLGDDGYTYDGNVYAAPDGPYHYLILGDQVTLNGNGTTGVPFEFRCDTNVTEQEFNAADFARWGITINEAEGIWDLELAIYHPHVNSEARIGFNLGGSQGSEAYNQVNIDNHGWPDAYAYYTWQPNTPNEPFFAPLGESDAGMYNLVTSEYWAVLNMKGSIINSVREEPAPLGPPTQFSLMQNYPNPFNPATTIRFEVAKKSDISLKVYNVVGQEVATLIYNQELDAGVYSASFNANNLASGIYFYELKAGEVSISKKMVLLK